MLRHRPVLQGTRVLCLAALLTSCGTSTSPPATEPTVFAVVTCSHEGATSAHVDESILVQFTEDVLESTVTDSSVALLTGPGQLHDCHLSTLGSVLTVRPAAPLSHATEYTLRLSVLLGGTTLGTLREPVEILFRTAAAPAPRVEIPPFDVVRHGSWMSAVWATEEGAISVGDGSMVLVSSPAGRFVYPLSTEVTGHPEVDLNSVFAAGLGTLYLGGNLADDTEAGVVVRVDDRRAKLDGLLGVKCRALHGTSAGRVYAAAGRDVWVRTDDPGAAESTRWHPAGPTPSTSLALVVEDVWASPTDVVYAAGSDGLYYVVDPTPGEENEFTRLPTGIGAYRVVRGISPTHVAGTSHDSTTWWNGVVADRVTVNSGSLIAMSWPSADFAIQVGVLIGQPESPSVVYDDPLDDHEGREVPIPTDGGFLTSVSAWTVGEDKFAVAVGSSGQEFRYSDTTRDPSLGTWSRDDLVKHDGDGALLDWQDLSGSPDLAVLYAVRDGQLLQLELASATWTVHPPAGMDDLHRLHAVARDDVWATGIREGELDWFLYHFDGSTWSQDWITALETPNDLWVADDGTVFVACDDGTVYRMGNGWLPMTAVHPTENLLGVWGTSANAVWVCGENGTLSHYVFDVVDETWAWTPAPLDGITDVHLRALDGTGDTHVVAVGDQGTVLRYDGTAWSDMGAGDAVDLDGVDLTMVWTEGPDHVWAASADQVVIYWDGSTWVRWSLGVGIGQLRALWGEGVEPHADLWLCGDEDLLLHHAEPPRVLPFLDRD